MSDSDRVPYRAAARGRLIALACVLGLAFSWWAENQFSQHFQACVTQARNHQSANNHNKARFTFGRWVGPQFGCSVDFLDQHNGFIGALAGIAVAAFTLTLKRSTDRLWIEAERQRAKMEEIAKGQTRDMRDSIAAMDRSAIATKDVAIETERAGRETATAMSATATATRVAAEAAKEQAGLLKRQADAMDKQVALIECQLAASEETAKVARLQTKFAIASMRAAMTPAYPTPIKPSAVDWIVEIWVINTGRAAGTIGDTYVRFCDDLPAVPDYDKTTMQRREDLTLLAPGARKLVGVFSTDSRKEGQYFYGFIEFGDEIGRWRRRFCAQILVRNPVGTNIYYPTRGDAAFNVRIR